MSNKIFLSIFVLVLIVAAVVGFSNKKAPVSLPPSENVSTSTPISGSDSTIGVSGTGDYTVEEVPLAHYPSLERPVVVPIVFQGEARKIMEKNIASTIALLKKNQEDTTAWSRLATYRKIIDDYVGAAEISEFLVERGSNDPTLFGNLGELYHLYLKEYAKSETNYKKAISLSPKNLGLYRGLHELYRYSYKKETTLAADILKEGIVKNPEAIELMVLLGNYYRDKDDATDARVYYEKAVVEARKQGNVALAAQIESDLQKLK